MHLRLLVLSVSLFSPFTPRSQNRSAAYFNTNRKRIADINVGSLNEITIIKELHRR